MYYRGKYCVCADATPGSQGEGGRYNGENVKKWKIKDKISKAAGGGGKTKTMRKV